METIDIIVATLIVVMLIGVFIQFIMLSYRFWPWALLILIVIVVFASIQSDPEYQKFRQIVIEEKASQNE
jgi:hypothetical protein